MSDPYKQYRKSLADQIAKDLRQAALDSDDFGHPMREVAFSQWLLRHPFTAGEIDGQVREIGKRREWQ